MKKLAMLCLLPLLSACAAVVIGSAGEGARVVAQERSAGEAVDDAGIYLLIKHHYLKQNTNDLFANVDVKVTEGRVLLTGNVDQPESQVEAVRLAWEVKGVREVINEIQINDQSGLWNYTRDVWISTQIRSRLLVTKGIRSINYSIVTVNQVVYILGIAQDQTELDKVTYIASVTSYVERVVSHVRMKDDPARPQ